jgi:hypothetical protein
VIDIAEDVLDSLVGLTAQDIRNDTYSESIGSMRLIPLT